MSEKNEKPRYMEKLLATLGWNQGTRIPLANPDNQALENLLIERQNEIQRLKEDLILQKQKRADLNKYKESVQTENQENTRLLFAQKHQLEQEVKLRQLAINEAERCERDILDCQKKIKQIDTNVERFQGIISKLLKRADELKTEVCGDKGALTDWRAAIERGSSDIAAIEQFTKQDISRAKALEVQRQRLKLEHDRWHERLTQLISNLAAEERAAERLSVAVAAGIQQRQQTTAMWAAAVENLRNRDKDIRHIREDYAVLEEEAARIAELTREQQAFYEQQSGNNAEAFKDNRSLLDRLGNMRVSTQALAEENVTLESELKANMRELSSLQANVLKLRAENRQIMEDQHKKDLMLSQITQKIKDLKLRVVESTDKTKSAEKRAKELEEMLNDEERYASGLTQNQQRAMHCSFVEQQKLLALQNEEKLYHMQMKASKLILSKLDTKQAEIEKKLQAQKETLYIICYQLEMNGARVMHMEGMATEREANAELAAKEDRLKDILSRHATRVTLLERHSRRLNDDMRRLAREIEYLTNQHNNMKSTLKSFMLNVTGGIKELEDVRKQWHRDRVEEALVKMRVAHAARAVSGVEDAAFSLDKQRVHLDAAMNERMLEINARRDMFAVQKRALMDDCSQLNVEIKERENRISQLMKRYEIFISSIGKDDSGQELNVSFFKIKLAAERAELREKGAALDADIGRWEKDVSALEATMRVVAAAHSHFLRHISPLADDTPEMEEIRQLTEQYHELRDQLKVVRADVSDLEIKVADLSSRLTTLLDKTKHLSARESEAENDLEAAKERLQKQQVRLQNAHDVVRHYAKRAKRLMDDADDWRIFQLSLWVRDYTEAAYNALSMLAETCSAPCEVRERLAAALSATDLLRLLGPHQRRMRAIVQQFLDLEPDAEKKGVQIGAEESIFSTSSESARSGYSQASGFTQRFAQFRKTLSTRVREPALAEENPEKSKRSSVSLRVVTLGLEESVALVYPSTHAHLKPRKSQ